MPIDIIVVAFAILITYILVIIGAVSASRLFTFLGFMTGLVFTAFLIAGDGLITLSSVYNVNTATWIHNTTTVYPFFVIGFAMINIFNFLILLAILSAKMESSNDSAIN